MPDRWRSNNPLVDVSTLETAQSLQLLGTQPPISGQVVEIGKGVFWMRLSLPFAIDHINIWALEDTGGWAIVDCGAYTDGTIAAWNQLIEGPLAGKPISRVLATHMHADHVGMAGWLVRTTNSQLWMTRLEYLTCRVMVNDTGREAPEAGIRFYHAAGWNPSNLDNYRKKFGNYGRRISQLPDSFRRIVDGEQLQIGEHSWEVVIGSGHSPEHACFYCAEQQLLISGDQVLPKISSNVSVIPTEPAADPLRDWIRSLEMLRERIPDEVLVLPAHDEPFRGLHGRLDSLKFRHQAALERLRSALDTPKRATDVFPVLFRRPITAELLHMATGESLAHLNYLMHSNQITGSADAEGVTWYQRLVHP